MKTLLVILKCQSLMPSVILTNMMLSKPKLQIVHAFSNKNYTISSAKSGIKLLPIPCVYCKINVDRMLLILLRPGIKSYRRFLHLDC